MCLCEIHVCDIRVKYLYLHNMTQLRGLPLCPSALSVLAESYSLDPVTFLCWQSLITAVTLYIQGSSTSRPARLLMELMFNGLCDVFQWPHHFTGILLLAFLWCTQVKGLRLWTPAIPHVAISAWWCNG